MSGTDQLKKALKEKQPKEKPSRPWEVHWDLTRQQTEQYLSIGTSKFYELVRAGILETYSIAENETKRPFKRVKRESIEALRNRQVAA